MRNITDVYSFRFDYTNDKEPVVAFSHTFTNKRVNAKISLQKKDKETNTNTPQGDAFDVEAYMKHQLQLRMNEEFDLFEVDGSENEDMGENSEGM